MVMFDSSKYQWFVEDYTLNLTHNVVAPVQTGIVSPADAKPISVFLVRARLGATTPGIPDQVIGFSWTLDANNVPQVTALFNNNVTAQCHVAVAYLK